MNIFQAAAYGLIQGLTEFLPVSSSAHLTLLPVFTGWEDPGLAFDVALHWGTLIAAVVYFRKDIVNLILTDRPLCWKIAVATVPGAIIGLLFEKQAESAFRSPTLLAITLSIMGIALFISDRWGSKKTSIAQISWAQALIIGVAQGIAIIPGVSRSGVTITTALLLGIDRESAVRFSFFLAMPITFGAGLVKSKYLIQNIGDPAIGVGLLVSAISGLAAIHILITYVRKRSFTPFVVYRLALAAAIVAFLATH